MRRSVPWCSVVWVCLLAASVSSAGEPAGVSEALLKGPLASLDSATLAQSRAAFDLSNLSQLEAERLMAAADAAVYAETGGRLLMLVNPAWSDPARLAEWLGSESAATSATLSSAQPETMTLTEFAFVLDRELPGLAAGAFGRYLLKMPIRMEAPDDVRPSPATPPASPTTDVLVEGFESGFYPTWTSTRWLRSPAATEPYTWNGITCDKATGSVSIDAWRGGTSGGAYQANCTQAYPNNLGLLWTYDSTGVNISGASQAWLEISVAVWTENLQGDSLSILFHDPRDNHWIGFWHAGSWHDPWWRFTYDLKHWIGIGDLARFATNNLAFVFMSDSTVNPGFGARVDDVKISKNATPALTCSATATPTWGAAPLGVSFSGSYVGSLTGPQYFWAFKDGTSSTSQNPSHTFTASGDYDVWFEVASTTSHAKCLSTVHVTAHQGGDDNCGGATVIPTSSNSYTNSFDTAGYTRDQPGVVPTTDCNTIEGYEPGATLWYSYIPTRAGTGRAWACPNDPATYQPWLTTFSGTCGAQTWLHCWRFDDVTECGGSTPTPSVTMAPGTTYTWQVGGQADASGPGMMHFEFCPFPLGFAQQQPANGANLSSSPVTLQWQAATDATSYDVYFGTANPPPLFQNVAGTSLAVPVSNGTYHWKVIAKNSCGSTVSSSGVWGFTVCIPPAAPVLSSPANGGSVPAGPVTLQWGAATGASTYTVHFGTVNPPPVYQSGVTGTSLGVTATAGSTYYWKVVAVGCTSTSSAVWSFAAQTVAFEPQEMESVDGHSAAGTSSNLNGLLEPGERILVSPAWKNVGSGAASATGTFSAFTGPAGATYSTPDTSASYGSVAAGTTANCYSATGNCYQLQLSNPANRPATHWDATVLETLSNGQTHTWTIHVGSSFSDAPPGSFAYAYIEALLHSGITAGCGLTTFCPSDSLSRWQMAVFLAKALYGGVPPVAGTVPGLGPYNCVAGGTSVFGDVPPTDGGCRHIHYIAAEGITAGCGDGNYCPAETLTRWQMAVLLAKAMYGGVPPVSGTVPGMGAYNCVAGGSSVFADVPPTDSGCRYIHYIAAEGVTVGCGDGNYCPASALSRSEMAVFITKAFMLGLYEP